MSLDAMRIVDSVEAALNEHRKYVRDYFESAPTPPGLETVTDEQFMEFIQQMVQQSPPAPWLFPVLDKDGMPVLGPDGAPQRELRVVSPWIAVLSLKRRDPDGKLTGEPLVDGGDLVLARMERIAAHGGPHG